MPAMKDLKATDTPPNLDRLTEKMEDDPVSSEAAKKYRSDLGRFAWWSQTRADFFRYISILAMGQQWPTVGFEKGQEGSSSAVFLRRRPRCGYLCSCVLECEERHRFSCGMVLSSSV
jgi:hypothetical protein